MSKVSSIVKKVKIKNVVSNGIEFLGQCTHPSTAETVLLQEIVKIMPAIMNGSGNEKVTRDTFIKNCEERAKLSDSLKERIKEAQTDQAKEYLTRAEVELSKMQSEELKYIIETDGKYKRLILIAYSGIVVVAFRKVFKPFIKRIL